LLGAVGLGLEPANQRVDRADKPVCVSDDLLALGLKRLGHPLDLGQEFGGYAAQIDSVLANLQQAMGALCELSVGGTAVGTGLNAPKGLAGDICLFLAEENHLPFCETDNHFSASGARDIAVMASAALRGAAVTMGKIASDIRLMGSGPRCGLAELRLPSLQPGSSIMPGKVNPVICESVIQVVCQVIGLDAAIVAGATGGVGSILELNIAMPMIAANLLDQIQLLTRAAKLFTEKCVSGLKADEEQCRHMVERSLAMITVLAPKIGYDQAAMIVKKAYATGRTIRELCLAREVLPENELNELLDPYTQTGD